MLLLVKEWLEVSRVACEQTHVTLFYIVYFLVFLMWLLGPTAVGNRKPPKISDVMVFICIIFLLQLSLVETLASHFLIGSVVKNNVTRKQDG